MFPTSWSTAFVKAEAVLFGALCGMQKIICAHQKTGVSCDCVFRSVRSLLSEGMFHAALHEGVGSLGQTVSVKAEAVLFGALYGMQKTICADAQKWLSVSEDAPLNGAKERRWQ